MKTILLKRVSATDRATFGVIIREGIPLMVTLEDAWRNNARGESCILSGAYICKRVISPKFGETFEVTGVPGRDHILFHAGNTEMDTEGCILVGKSFGMIGDRPGILASKPAFEEFLKGLVGIGEFTLIVTQDRS